MTTDETPLLKDAEFSLVSMPFCNTGNNMVASGTSSSAPVCRIYRIIFFARGEVGSGEQACFGFTCAADEQHAHPAVHCHIFRYLIHYFHVVVCSVADPGSSVFLTSGPEPEWTIWIVFPRAWKQFLELKYLNFFDADADPDPESGNLFEPGSGIQEWKNLELPCDSCQLVMY